MGAGASVRTGRRGQEQGQGGSSIAHCDVDGGGDPRKGANAAMTPVDEALDLVRRAPHVLAPRFKTALYDHVTVLGEVRLRVVVPRIIHGLHKQLIKRHMRDACLKPNPNSNPNPNPNPNPNLPTHSTHACRCLS
jgi:hypothetical protein